MNGYGAKEYCCCRFYKHASRLYTLSNIPHLERLRSGYWRKPGRSILFPQPIEGSGRCPGVLSSWCPQFCCKTLKPPRVELCCGKPQPRSPILSEWRSSCSSHYRWRPAQAVDQAQNAFEDRPRQTSIDQREVTSSAISPIIKANTFDTITLATILAHCESKILAAVPRQFQFGFKCPPSSWAAKHRNVWKMINGEMQHEK